MPRPTPRTLLLLPLLALGVLGVAGAVFAHHSRAMFEMAQNVTLRGTVKEYRWQDPHSHILVTIPKDTEDASIAGTWDIEASAISLMTTRGWTPNTFKPGDPITVVVHPDKNRPRDVLLFYVIKPDGKRLYRAANRYPGEV